MNKFLTIVSIALIVIASTGIQAGTSCGCGKSRTALEQA